jgi:hypothetical protein
VVGLVALDAGLYHRPVSPVRAETCVKRLRAAPVDWAEVLELLVESYCLTAPKRLAAAVGG